MISFDLLFRSFFFPPLILVFTTARGVSRRDVENYFFLVFFFLDAVIILQVELFFNYFLDYFIQSESNLIQKAKLCNNNLLNDYFFG